MWEERNPNPGETVKVEYAEWTGVEPKIGIFLRRHDGCSVINIGRRLLYWEGSSILLVWNPNFVS